MSNFAHANKGTTYTVNHYLATKHIGIWCNGNTTDSGPVILGSSPSIPTNEKVQQMIVAPFCVYARHEHCLTGGSPEQALIAGIA